MDKRDDPSTPSSAYEKMAPAWCMIDDILAGPATIRSKGERYLPKNPAESADEYKRRLKMAPWVPEFADIVQTLSSKPFGSEVALGDGASDQIKALYENIDGQGNNLTAFSRPLFKSGVAKGMSAILVDNTGTGQARTKAEEQQAGVRPYWVAYRADDIIDLKSAFFQGKRTYYHVRLKECATLRDGYQETKVERIRELNREPTLDARGRVIALGAPTWQLHQKTSSEAGDTWQKVDEGQFAPVTEIPFVTFWTGEREGDQCVRPPLEALADLQIKLYHELSRKDEAFHAAGFPMLAANGLGPPAEGEVIETGPNRILYAGAQGASWDIIGPDADVLRVLIENVAAVRDELRRLGMQPLTQKANGVTATAANIEGAKAHSVVEAWALGFKDVLEQAFVFTAQWLGEKTTVEVTVDTDFSVDSYAQAPLDTATKARTAGDLSRRTYWDVLRRFDVLAPDFDADAEEEAIAEEGPALGMIKDPKALPTDPNADPALAV